MATKGILFVVCSLQHDSAYDFKVVWQNVNVFFHLDDAPTTASSSGAEYYYSAVVVSEQVGKLWCTIERPLVLIFDSEPVGGGKIFCSRRSFRGNKTST
jgi:hypothetical protein